MKQDKWTSDFHRVRDSQQDRGRKTQAALLDAAETLFGEHGIDRTTVAQIAAAASCSIGAFYHHYRDKEAVQFALFERLSTEFEQMNHAVFDSERWSGATFAEVLSSYLEVAVVARRTMPERLRTGLELARVDPEMRKQFARHRSERGAAVRRLLLERIGEVGHPDAETAIGFVVEQCRAMLRIRMIEPDLPSMLDEFSDEDFVRYAVTSACAFLQVELPPDFFADR